MPVGSDNLKGNHDTGFTKNHNLRGAASREFAAEQVDLKSSIRNKLILRKTEWGKSFPKFNSLNSSLNDLTVRSSGTYKKVNLRRNITIKWNSVDSSDSLYVAKSSTSYQTENAQPMTLTKLLVEIST